ncbi:hypothetical protein VTN02DRAFT_5688 [Thermoascus thermophilus]
MSVSKSQTKSQQRSERPSRFIRVRGGDICVSLQSAPFFSITKRTEVVPISSCQSNDPEVLTVVTRSSERAQSRRFMIFTRNLSSVHISFSRPYCALCVFFFLAFAWRVLPIDHFHWFCSSDRYISTAQLQSDSRRQILVFGQIEGPWHAQIREGFFSFFFFFFLFFFFFFSFFFFV